MANLMIDRGSADVFHKGGKLDVNEMEFEILWALVNKPGKSFSARDLMHIVGPFNSANPANIKTAMESLASKLTPWVFFDQSANFQFRRA